MESNGQETGAKPGIEEQVTKTVMITNELRIEDPSKMGRDTDIEVVLGEPSDKNEGNERVPPLESVKNAVVSTTEDLIEAFKKMHKDTDIEIENFKKYLAMTLGGSGGENEGDGHLPSLEPKGAEPVSEVPAKTAAVESTASETPRKTERNNDVETALGGYAGNGLIPPPKPSGAQPVVEVPVKPAAAETTAYLNETPRKTETNNDVETAHGSNGGKNKGKELKDEASEADSSVATVHDSWFEDKARKSEMLEKEKLLEEKKRSRRRCCIAFIVALLLIVLSGLLSGYLPDVISDPVENLLFGNGENGSGNDGSGSGEEGPTLAPTIFTPMVDIFIQFDSFPQEISWQLTNKKNGNVIFEVDPATYLPGMQDITHHVEVKRGVSYIFHIYDSGGNGLCCYHGFYRISYEGAILANVVGDFGSEYESYFTIPKKDA